MICVGLKCPALTQTVYGLQRKKELREKRGIEFRYDPIITPQEKGDVRPILLQLAPKELLELDEPMAPVLDSCRAQVPGSDPYGRRTAAHEGVCEAARYLVSL